MEWKKFSGFFLKGAALECLVIGLLCAFVALRMSRSWKREHQRPVHYDRFDAKTHYENGAGRTTPPAK